jgi:hypothetical protein
MPRRPKSKLQLLLVDTFPGCVEAFLWSKDHAREVVWVLITKIIPHFHLPKKTSSNNKPTFKAEVTQGLSRALGIKYLCLGISNHLKEHGSFLGSILAIITLFVFGPCILNLLVKFVSSCLKSIKLQTPLMKKKKKWPTIVVSLISPLVISPDAVDPFFAPCQQEEINE